jgi:hypothetical protein
VTADTSIVRRLLVTVLLCLFAAPAVALAVNGSSTDGTLAVYGASGSVSIAARGAMIGQIDHGKVILEDPDPKDGPAPVVWGYESKRDLTDTKSLYSGSDIRFRIGSGFFRIKVVGTGVDLSIVGRGSITLAPTLGVVPDGSYSMNGGTDLPYPDVLTSLQLGSPTPGG